MRAENMEITHAGPCGGNAPRTLICARWQVCCPRSSPAGHWPCAPLYPGAPPGHAAPGTGSRPVWTSWPGTAPALLAGRRVGLITNHTGVDATGRSTISIILHADPRPASSWRCSARSMPSPGRVGTRRRTWRADAIARTGLPIHSCTAKRAAPNRGDARGHRRPRLRHPGHRHALLHVRLDHGPFHGGGGGARMSTSSSSTGPTPSAASSCRATSSTRRSARSSALPRTHAPRPHRRRAGPLVNAEFGIGARLHRRPPRGLAARVVRRHRPAVDRAVAEHAGPRECDALPGHLPLRGDEPVRRAAARRRRSGRSARRGSMRSRWSAGWRRPAARRPLRGDDVHAAEAPGDGMLPGHARATACGSSRRTARRTIRRTRGSRCWSRSRRCTAIRSRSRQSHFDRLAGTDRVRHMLRVKARREQITATWPATSWPRSRSRCGAYLLYP
jgi:hypothetical protein